MLKKKLGNSDMLITRMGFGAWAIGGSGWEYAWGAQDDSKSIEAIHAALELGINWIDTAAAYGLGHSEEIVARALKSWKGERPYVFTKCALIGDEQGKMHRSHKAESIKKECEASLRRLESDTIDLYQIHWPSDKGESENEEAWDAMAQLKKEGKVRWIGVSNFSTAQLDRIKAIAPITSLQPPYSLLNREVESEILPYCQKEGLGVIVYSPMASGLLTGAMTRERIKRMPEDDWRKKSWDFTEPRLSRNLSVVEKLKEIGKRHDGAGAGEIAIAWVLKNPAVTAAIVGGRSSEQVKGTINAPEIELTDEETRELEEV
ncbi:MAG: aldo/keto reductase [Ignavibacteria bacterium]|jgi:aryl-alcohol dehydrogenase-like predicted oxidoreductase|nr:aldo/keto reductase [Ignavibacteria bacterium]MCU7504918.1 aldo/keto reductase [Ignavibacteria bacterium]MCU7517790.1 aldo/keto reductase [Ignavibacteria bacterium]